jgi:hypothetical protein
MSKIIGVDTSIIDNISGLGTGGGGIPAIPVTQDSGVVVCPYNQGPYGPFSQAELSGYQNQAHMYKLSDLTGVKELVYYEYQWGILKTNGDFYVGGFSNTGSYGLSFQISNSLIYDGGVELTLTNVAKVSAQQGGFFAIKNNGELWWCGSVNQYLDNTGVGQSTTSASYTWLQVGSDTDWVDIKAYNAYPYTAVAIKGSSGSQYLYSCGYNANYGTGLGTTSGITKQWTRVKSDATTDLSESFSEVAFSYGSCLAVTEGGKLFSFGENQYGSLGTGNTTDKPYATQVGSATNWSKCWVQRYGGWALNTSGEMFMSTTRTSWKIEPNTTGLYTKINNDTDYQDLAVFWRTTNSMDYTIFAKKNGAWYVSTPYNQPSGSWVGSTAATSTPENSWSALSTYMENYPTGTIDYLLPFHGQSSSGEPAIMFALS